MLRSALLMFAVGATMSVSLPALAETATTRFGTLSTNDDNLLLFNGQPVTPEVQGNESLSFLKTMGVGGADAVVVQDNGGTACPAQYYVVTVSAAGAKATKAFGTCSDLAKITQQGNAIVLTMPSFMGELESRAAIQRAAQERHVFKVDGGLVTDNGKPIR
jgi:hypothetical protein